jgi:hypothetical protein
MEIQNGTHRAGSNSVPHRFLTRKRHPSTSRRASDTLVGSLFEARCPLLCLLPRDVRLSDPQTSLAGCFPQQDRIHQRQSPSTVQAGEPVQYAASAGHMSLSILVVVFRNTPVSGNGRRCLVSHFRDYRTIRKQGSAVGWRGVDRRRSAIQDRVVPTL